MSLTEGLSQEDPQRKGLFVLFEYQLSHNFFVNVLVGVDSDIAGAYFDVGVVVQALIEIKYIARNDSVVSFSKDKFYYV